MILTRAFVFGTLMSLVVVSSFPHYHEASTHDVEICAGHLDHQGAPDFDHRGSCGRCTTPQRNGSELPILTLDANPKPQPTLAAPLADREQMRRRLVCGAAVPRAPPVLSRYA